MREHWPWPCVRHSGSRKPECPESARQPNRAKVGACRPTVRGPTFRRASIRPWAASWLVRRNVGPRTRSEEHTSELQSRGHLVCRLLLEKKKQGEETSVTCPHHCGV